MKSNYYIKEWLTAGPVCSKYTPKSLIEPIEFDQLGYEKKLRATFEPSDDPVCPTEIKVGDDAPCGKRWGYDYNEAGESIFVDKSYFYSNPTLIKLDAATVLQCEEDVTVTAVLWTYAHVDIYINGEKIAVGTKPVYKPIKKSEHKLNLVKGENVLFIRLSDLGIRDARTLFGVELLSDNVKVTLDSPTKQDQKIEFIDSEKPSYKPTSEPINEILAILCAQESEPRGSGAHFAAYNVLARYALSQSTKNDEALIKKDLEFIDTRGDCSDFLVAAIIRLMLKYDLSKELFDKIKKSLLNFRYWMDEPGNDGMCFWSENHALMFHGSQLILSDMFKDDLFENSGKYGKEVYPIALKRCEEWLCDIETEDFEEFNSATYVPVTVAALLNLVDFAPHELSLRATKLLDKIFFMLCKHVFDEVVITPQGRVYRDVIAPFKQSVQSILYLIDSSVPLPKSPVPFVSMFATTKYEFPENIREILEKDYDVSYVTGRTQVNLCKNKNYILTSVNSPANVPVKTWQNVYGNKNIRHDSYLFTKSMNECFHGTSHFRPGVLGYQQHLWTAALSKECTVFVNHPGTDVDGGGMRPGYWYGNGVTPAIKQEKNVLGAIYLIPKNNPISFTHVFWPSVHFDKTLHEDGYLVGKSANGYIGIWCSEPLTPYNESVLQNCEYRCYSTEAAYVCICAKDNEAASLTEFLTLFKTMKPCYNKGAKTLSINEKPFIKYTVYDDETQYV